MKRNHNVFWGIIILAIGIILFGNSLNLWNIEIFFNGWWTLFIIVPSLYGLLNKEWTSSLLGLLIGTFLLLASQDVITWKNVGELFIPSVLVIVGLTFIFKPRVKNVIVNKKGLPEYVGVFASNEEKVTAEFNGASVVAVFGGVDLDLTKAKIDHDIIIDCVTVFGGIDIKAPDNVKIKTSGVPLFGGIENKTDNEGKYTILINYVCIFAGVDVK